MCMKFIDVVKNQLTELFSKQPSTKQLPPIENFELDRYLGQWYEIGRYDHQFQRGLTNVKTVYTKIGDKKISIINSGVNDGVVKTISGVGEFKQTTDIGWLKVSFVRPFWSDYKIIYIDQCYNTAIITSSTMNYLWILSRTKHITDKHRTDLIKICNNLGFKSKLIVWN